MANFRLGGFPPVTNIVKNLIIINVLVFLTTYMLETRGVNVDAVMALHYWQSPLFRWWQLVTHLFMHANLEHIFFNMFGLYMFGSILENVWGPKRFLIFYLVCGVGAACCHLGILTFEFTKFHNAFMYYQQHPTFVEYAQFLRHQNLMENPNFAQLLSYWGDHQDCSNCAEVGVKLINTQYTDMMNEATVGASGAIFGLLFAFGYLFPNMPMMLLFIPVPIKAKWLVTGYGALELFSGIRNSAGDNVAHFAHLGGMLFAFILLRIWKNTTRNRFY